MHFELEKLFRRKLIKDFFASYSESKWESLLLTTLEIGVAYLINNYNISKLSLENLQNILIDLKSPNSQLTADLKLKSKGKENQISEPANALNKNKIEANNLNPSGIPKPSNSNVNKPIKPINPIYNQVMQNNYIQEPFLNQNALKNTTKPVNSLNNYYPDDYPNFINQRLSVEGNANNNLNNLNNAQKNAYANAALKSEPNRLNLNVRDKSPINSMKTVSKVTGSSNKIPNVAVHNHIAETVTGKSAYNSNKAENRSKSKNKIYIRNKSKNDYETTKNNIFPNQKPSAHKKKKTKSKHKQASTNKTFNLNADIKDYSPNFNTEPSYSSHIYDNKFNNINYSYLARNFLNNTQSEINNGKNYNMNNYPEYNKNFNNDYYINNANINQGKNRIEEFNRIKLEEKTKNNSYLKNDNANQRGRQVDSAKIQNPLNIRNYTNSRSNSAGYVRKPSSEWRRGDDSLEPQRVHNAINQNFNINNSQNYEDNNIRNVNGYNEVRYNPNRQFNNQAYNANTPQKPQMAAPSIYPKWWDHSNSYSVDYESNQPQNLIHPSAPYQNQNQNYNQIYNPFSENSNYYVNENLQKNNADNLTRTQPNSLSNNIINLNNLNKQNQSNFDAEQHNSVLKQREKYLEKMHEEQEVYYSDYESQNKQKILKEIQKKKSNSNRKMKEYNHERRADKIDVSKIESKIKEKVKNDKQNFKEKRREADEYYKSLGFKNYEDWVNYNDNKEKPEDDTRYKRYQGPTIVKKNFLISYDKNLQPADVKENLKEIPIKKAKAMNLVSQEESKLNNLPYNESRNNNNNYYNSNANYYGGNVNSKNLDGYKDEFNSRENDSYGMNYQNKYGTGEDYRMKDYNYGDYNRNDNSNSKNYNARALADNLNENSFKNCGGNADNMNNFNSEENNADPEKEMLSSFSPSEKTKNFFQREMGQEKYFENENPKNYQNANDSQVLSTNSLRMNSLEEPLMKNNIKSPGENEDLNNQNN